MHIMGMAGGYVFIFPIHILNTLSYITVRMGSVLITRPVLYGGKNVSPIVEILVKINTQGYDIIQVKVPVKMDSIFFKKIQIFTKNQQYSGKLTLIKWVGSEDLDPAGRPARDPQNVNKVT